MKACALAELGAHLDAALEHLAKMLADRQAEAGAAEFLSDGSVRLVIGTEDVLELLGANAHAVVIDLKLEDIVVRVIACADPNFAVIGEFGGIAQEIEEIGRA